MIESSVVAFGDHRLSECVFNTRLCTPVLVRESERTYNVTVVYSLSGLRPSPLGRHSARPDGLRFTNVRMLRILTTTSLRSPYHLDSPLNNNLLLLDLSVSIISIT